MLKPSYKLGFFCRSCIQTFKVLLILGVAATSAIQRADAMTQRKQSELGEILTESVSGELHCEIVTKTVSQSLELTGVVWSDVSSVGNYSFVVTKQGVSGRSNVAQSGLYETALGEKKSVGTIMVNALRGDRYLARLSARSNGNEVVCEISLE